jgi:rsbT co-antagonist protein RsbR
VDIGVDFGRLPTLRNLKHGLREALRHAKREREGLRDVTLDDDQNAKLGAAAARS